MNIKLTLSYDGTSYCGWQIQKNGVSVQEELEKAVFLTTGEKVKITGSGRTDAGVHAKGQVANFNTNSTIPPEKFYKALNVHLPYDIRVLKSELEADDFSARKSAKRKTYSYSFYISETEQPLKERYAVKLDRAPDIQKMDECAKLFIGEHDFKCFNASGGGAKTTVRTVYDISVEKDNDRITIFVTGNGFLYNMVRTLVGTLLSFCYGQIDLNTIKTMLDSGDRSLCGRTLPARGLCLESVCYD